MNYRMEIMPLEYLNKIICIMEGGRIRTYYKNGKLIWKKEFKEDIVSGLIDGNKLYVSLMNERIYGININKGKIEWRYEMPKVKKDQLFMIYYVK